MSSQVHSHEHGDHHHHHGAEPSGSAEAPHDFVAANKSHHNEAGHSHGHASSALNQWLGKRIAEAIMDAVDFDEDTTTVLDFACGAGLVAQNLAPFASRIVGVDLSERMVEQFNLAVANQGIDPSEMMAVQKDVLLDEDAELDGELFDVVVCAQAYHHIPDIDATTLALSRRVKPGGHLVVVDLDSTSGFAELKARTPKAMADKISKVVAHKSGFTEQELQACFEKSDRLETMLSEMQAIKGVGNWADGMVGGAERPDVEIRHLIVVGFITSNPYNVPPSKVIILEGGGTRSLTFQDYCDAMANTAAGVAASFPELAPGDVVGVLSTNTLEMTSLILGLSGAGLVPAMVPPAATPPELAHSFKLVAPDGPKVIFVHPALIAGAKEGIALAGFARMPKLVSMLPGTPGLPSVQGRLNPRPLTNLSKPARDTLAMIFYSSGTTGPFKGVQLSHRNLIANAKQIVATSPETFRPESTMLSFLPLYHSYGLISTILGAPLSGTLNVHLEKFEPELFLSSIQKHKVTNISIVPPVALLMAKHPMVDNYDLSSLQSLGISAAPTKKELMDLLRKRLNVKVVQGYGMTEASPGTHQLVPSLEFEGEGSVGQLFPDMECRIVNAEGKDVGNDEEGEIVLRGPNIMLGYINNPAATADAIRDGWLHTGDVGVRRSDKGFYWIVDRLKELIKVRGFQVAPAELEGILLSLPMVQDCAVTAFYDDDKATEFPRAFVVVASDKDRTPAMAAEIRALVDSRVAHYKWLVGGVHFLDAIPKNGSGKILRRLLPKTVESTKATAKL
ncbi:hypothetical protein RQP46_009181 [Phenoliferia psychrophenolica]